MNDPKRTLQAASEPLTSAVRQAMESGFWLNGPKTLLFSKNFAEYIGVSYCIGVANGSDALEISLRALLSTGRAEGDELVTVSNAGGYASIAAFLVGLIPVYADIEYKSQLASIPSIVSCLSPRTAVVVATHLYGGALDVPLLRMALDKAGYAKVPILEDCAQAHGSRIGRRRVGSLGDIATFSFYPTKNLGAFGDAGAIVTNDNYLLEAAKKLSQYGWSQKYKIESPGGRNSRIDEVQAAYLNVLLEGLDKSNARRVDILNRYSCSLPAVCTLVRPQTDTVAHLAVLLVDHRDQLRAHLDRNGIASDIHYPVLDVDQLGWADLPKREGLSGLSVTRESSPRLLSIPCFSGMTNSEVAQVCSALSSWDGQSQ